MTEEMNSGWEKKHIKSRIIKRERGKKGLELLEIAEQTAEESKTTHLWARADR